MKNLLPLTSLAKSPGFRVSPLYWLNQRERLRQKFWRYLVIATFGFPILASLGVSLLGLELSFPDCQFQATFGFPAPSCGLTRSFLALVRGDIPTALQYHLLGPFFFAFFVAMVTTACTELLWRRSLMEIYAALVHYKGILTVSIVALSYYGIRLWALLANPALPLGLDQMGWWQFMLEGAKAL